MSYSNPSIYDRNYYIQPQKPLQHPSVFLGITEYSGVWCCTNDTGFLSDKHLGVIWRLDYFILQPHGQKGL